MIRVIHNLNCNEHYSNGIWGRWITNGYHMLCLLHWMLFVVWYQQVPLVWVPSHPFWVSTPTQVLWQVLWVNCFMHAAQRLKARKKRTREREREIWITLRLLYSLPKITPLIPINAGDTWRIIFVDPVWEATSSINQILGRPVSQPDLFFLLIILWLL